MDETEVEYFEDSKVMTNDMVQKMKKNSHFSFKNLRDRFIWPIYYKRIYL